MASRFGRGGRGSQSQQRPRGGYSFIHNPTTELEYPPSRFPRSRGYDRGRGRGRGHGRGDMRVRDTDMYTKSGFVPRHPPRGSETKRLTVDEKDHSWNLRRFSLREIMNLSKMQSEELIGELSCNMKPFQITLQNADKLAKKDGIIDAIIKILLTLANSIDTTQHRELVIQILAEALSIRCPQFHLQLKLYVSGLKMPVSDIFGKYPPLPVPTKVQRLCKLFKILLEVLPDSSWSCLPVDELQDAMQQLHTQLSPHLLREVEEIAELRNEIKKQSIKKQHVPAADVQEWDNSEYRHVQILPKWEEVCISDPPAKLRPSIVSGPYKDWMHYYDVQFRLLREDFVAPLRKGISEFLSGVRGRKLQNVKIYHSVMITNPVFMRSGLCYSLQFDVSRLQRYNWEHSKRLLFGSLLCLSPDHFKSTIFFATVSNRDPAKLREGKLEVQFEEGARILPFCQNTTFTMVESLAYFEASRHILHSLQTAEVDTMPFTRYLIENQCTSVAPPQYLVEAQYNLNCLYGSSKSPLSRQLLFDIRDITQWPGVDEIELDQSQLEGIQMALTQEIAVIQGPPGTGKTYIGLKITEALLQNRDEWDPERESPIIVMCFTNHALDQFLEGILSLPTSQVRYVEVGPHYKNLEPEVETTPKIVRVGGRSQSELVKQLGIDRKRRNVYLPGNVLRNLNELREAMRLSRSASLWQQLGCYRDNTTFLNFHQIQPFMDPDHLYQILHQTNSQEEENCALRIWLGIFTVERIEQPAAPRYETEFEEEMPEFEGDYEHQTPSQHTQQGAEVLLNVAPMLTNPDNHDLTTAAQPERITTSTDSPTENKTTQSPSDSESEYSSSEESEGQPDEELIDIQGEAAMEQSSRLLEMEDFRPMEFANLANQMETNSDQMFPRDRFMTYDARNPLSVFQQGPISEYGDPIPEPPPPSVRIVENENAPEIVQWGLQQPRMTETEVASITDVNRLLLQDHWRLYNYWRSKYLEDLMEENEKEYQEYNRQCKEYKQAQQQADRYALETADIIGMTTTGAAKYQHILHLVKPKIVIVEEAAEVLESHIVSALNAGTQHLILIGDHKQLRPKPNEYKLAKDYKLEVSLFERLIRNGFPHATLEIQHRMRPQIAELVCPHIYDKLINHESVLKYGDVKGICKNLFFIQHESPEMEDTNLTSHSNPHEASYIPALCKYLLQQGYKANQITVLVTYAGQLLTMRKEMPKRDFQGVRVCTVDNFQGEENDIILLSLVRSNSDGNPGFLRESNRVCVALSRAKMGFYCIGNFKMLRDKVVIWERIMSDMESKGFLGDALPLYCTNHSETKFSAKSPQDFKTNAPNGGCLRDCEYRLPCGHQCALKCHIEDPDHKAYECKKPCARKCPEGHPCPSKCYNPCKPCKVKVKRLMPECGHDQEMFCHQQPFEVNCINPCPKPCPEGHPCPFRCFEPCKPCSVVVTNTVPQCGHLQKMFCYQNPEYFKCIADCSKECENGHSCPKQCHESCGKCTFQMKKNIPECGHVIELPCYEEPAHTLCTRPCERKLKCGHHCALQCGKPCTSKPCTLKIQVELPCGHTKKVDCYNSSNSAFLRCEKPCERKLKCSHPCSNKCSDPCTEKCEVKVNKVWPCGHKLKRKCFQTQNPEQYPCEKRCDKKLPNCGHQCVKKCFESCTEVCKVPVQRKYPCGHLNDVPCSSTTEEKPCPQRCSATLVCGHECEGKCSACYAIRIHNPCKYPTKLPRFCGHSISVQCLGVQDSGTHLGKKQCTGSCPHAKCSHDCSTACKPCTQPCDWACPHYQCEKLCHEICERPPCNERCQEKLPCGHQCFGVCGEPCPSVCPQCKQKAFKKKLRGARQFKEDELYVQLGCNHIFPVEFFDRYMEQKPAQGVTVGPKRCPECSHCISSSFRYGNAVKHSLQDVQAVREIVQRSQGEYRLAEARRGSLMTTLQLLTDKYMVEHVKQHPRQISPKIKRQGGQVYRFSLHPPITETLLHTETYLKDRTHNAHHEEICLITAFLNAVKFLDAIETHEKGGGGDEWAKLRKQVTSHIEFLQILIRKMKCKLSSQLMDELQSEQYRLSLFIQLQQVKTVEPHLEASAQAPTEKFVKVLESDHSLKVTSEEFEEHSSLLRERIEKVPSKRVQLCSHYVLEDGDLPPMTKGQWHKCSQGHYYCTPATRKATQEYICPDCPPLLITL